MTNGEGSGTNGGKRVTNGWARRAAWLGAFVALAVLQASANVFSKIADKHDDGVAVDRFGVVLDEVSSLIAWFACLLVIWRLVRTVRPPRFGWPMTIALHAFASVAVSLLHVGLMVALREAGHALAGSDYSYTADWLGALVYEYRKDAVSYTLLAAFCAVGQWWWWREPVTAPATARPEPVIEVGEGARVLRIPVAEILWAEAAGNYVTLHVGNRELLHRTTLAALEAALAAHGFARIHRSRLVRRDAIRAIATGQSGDFTVTLTDGSELRGSRRYREGLRVTPRAAG